MKVESIAECSPWSILQYFWPTLSDNWSSFLSGGRQVLLYNQQSIYIYACKCLCQCVGKYQLWLVWYASLVPSFQKMTHHFLLHGSLRPTNLKKNLKPWIQFQFRPYLIFTFQRIISKFLHTSRPKLITCLFHRSYLPTKMPPTWIILLPYLVVISFI